MPGDTTTLARRSARALGWTWAGAVLRALLQLAAQIVIARLIGPEAFGQAAAVLLVLGIGVLLGEAGMAAALVQREPLAPGDAGIALAWALTFAVAAALGIVLVAPQLAPLLGDAALVPMLWAAAAIVPLHVMAGLPGAVLQRRFQAKRLQAIQLTAYTVGYGVAGVAAAWLGAGAWSLLIAFALHAAIVLVACASQATGLGWRPRFGSAAERAPLLGYGARTAAANVANWAIECVDRFAVGHAGGPAALGPYSAAANLARAPVALLVSSAQPVAFATAARLQDEHQRLARGWLAMLSLALLLALPLFAFLAWHGEAVVLLLYGQAWQAAVAPFAWLCAGVPFFVMLATTGPLLRGVDAVGSETRVQLAALLLALGLLVGVWAAGNGLSLVMVAAVVSLTTAVRAAGVSAALARRIGLAATEPWRCWSGALALGAVVLVLAAALAAVGVRGSAALLFGALLTPPVLVAVLRASRGALLGGALRLALANRRGDSRWADAACRWCGVVG